MTLEILNECETFWYILFPLIHYGYTLILKMVKTYFPRTFYKLNRNRANNILLKSYEKCKTFHVDGFLWIPAILKKFQKRRDHSFCLYREIDSSKMHRVKYLNFCGSSVWTSLCFLTWCFLPVILKPLTVIEQMLYRWKAIKNTQLFCVDQFFILAMAQKNFFNT